MENRVEELRKSLGLNQQELADILRVSRQTISSIETGRYNPSLKLAFSISDFFSNGRSRKSSNKKGVEKMRKSNLWFGLGLSVGGHSFLDSLFSRRRQDAGLLWHLRRAGTGVRRYLLMALLYWAKPKNRARYEQNWNKKQLACMMSARLCCATKRGALRLYSRFGSCLCATNDLLLFGFLPSTRGKEHSFRFIRLLGFSVRNRHCHFSMVE